MQHLILSSNNYHKEIDVETADDARLIAAHEAFDIDQAVDIFTPGSIWIDTVSPAQYANYCPTII